MAHRINRIRQLLLRQLSLVIDQLKDPRINLVTVVDVEVSKDLRHAQIYVSVVGDDEAKAQALEALKSAQGFIRREIAKRVQLRHVPEFTVRYDETSERAARLMGLLNNLQQPADD
ncbi:MAG: 30S ribosome-binding factor RbfA [Candidatus Latescibacteria bacterium]|nr:30S ribosome-binding factor RbfA [Candidatus Latescibacterota bacterium]